MSGPGMQGGARFLPWDTRFFGPRIATLAAHGIDEPRWRAALAWCRAERVECLYVLSNQDDRGFHARAEAAGALASASHTNSRFWKDPGFARERCAELYAIWIERDLRGLSTVFVTGEVGAPLGYVTVALAPGGSSIGLLAVSQNARRQGLGRRLMLRAFEFTRAAGLSRASFITQGPDNIALKLYEALGSKVERTEIWHHLWFPNKA